MAHLPIEKIKEKLNATKKELVLGSKYYHYKHPKVLYTIIDIVVEESTDEPMVIYESNVQKIKFARPFQSFMETIQTPDGKLQKRFTKIS